MNLNTDFLLSLYRCSFNPLNAFIWFELFGEPTDRDVDLLGGVKLHCIFFLLLSLLISNCPVLTSSVLCR
jgi:hypothetical protein